MSVVVRRATAAEVRPLRTRVLRRRPEPTVPAYDEDLSTLHLAAVDEESGVVVGCASVFPSAHDDDAAAWQLRGMAVEPALQGQGVGRLVLDAAVTAARDAGAPMLWAYGRVSALGFYTSLGWQVRGEVFLHGPDDLPHRRIHLVLR